MSVLRNAALVFGFGLVCNQTFDTAQSDAVPSQTSWLDWLINPSSTNANDDKHLYPQQFHQLKQSPGRVFVWGGTFGKTPREIKSLGNNSISVTAADGIGAAIDSDARVHAFTFDANGDKSQHIPFQASATQLSMRDMAQELVILSSAGKVYASQFTTEGSFQPARMLDGALRRARVEKIRCGKDHCVAITKEGKAISWGSNNSHGQLANGTVGDSSHDPRVPQYVKIPDGVNVRDVACGDRHTLFLDDNGVIYAAGDDKWAQLGISAEPWSESHLKTSGLVRKAELMDGIAGHAIAGGGQHTLILVRDGTVFSCGFNQWGQLGHHNYSSLAPPSPIADYNIRAIAITAGENHSCVVLQNGELRCIGGNEHGQLGLGTLQPSMVWKKVKVNREALKPSFVSSRGNVCAVIVGEVQEL